MNLRKKAILTACLLLAALLFVTGCAERKTPYQVNDTENYNVSVKFDANGGVFTTNTSVIMDSFNISELKTNSDGQAEIALLAPDSEMRGKNNFFSAKNNGYFLAGWYTERIENPDGEGYTYSGKWDFENDLLKVDASGTYTAEEPVVTLYAAWIPLFEIEFYDLDTGDKLESVTYDPTEVEEFLIPEWDTETGTLNMHSFPEKDDFTFNAVYYDEQGTEAVSTPAVVHPGEVDYATGTANNASLKLYVDWTEGEWYHIYTAEQFADNASLNGNYVILADLDFSEEIWPTSLMYGNFNGTIEGNGHSIKNVSAIQTNNSKVNAGLFGQLTDSAKISDLTFDNVTFTIQAGTRVVGTSYGLLAGTISGDAVLSNLKITNGALQIDSGSYFGADDYAIGLVCGMGNSDAVDHSGILCVASGDNPEKLLISVDGNAVSVEFVSE